MPPGREPGLRSEPPLERLLAPRREQFVRDHWGRAPLLLRAADRSGEDYAQLFSASAVDELLTRRGLRTPFLRLARSGRPFGDREFTTGGGVGAGIEDQVDEDAVRRRFATGATIVLQGLHRTWPPLADFATTLAGELGHPVQVNAYITPPGHQGFAAHYDVHDVFVLQVHGGKSWRVHPPVWPAPLRDQPWDDRKDAVAAAATAEPLLAAELTPGDLLYLPRGYLHSATASDGVSIHLTVGIHTWSRAHLVEAALAQVRRALAADPSLRESLPLGVDVTSPTDLEADVDVVRRAVAAAVAEVTGTTLARSLRGSARAAQRPAAASVLAQVAAADSLTGAEVLVARPGLLATLEPATHPERPGDDDGIVVRSRAGRCPAPAAAEPALRRLLGGDPVPVADLLPAGAAASALARTLLIEGVALVATVGPAPEGGSAGTTPDAGPDESAGRVRAP